jgi:hypothetical protein
MNEKDEAKVVSIIAKVLDMGLSKYHTLFLTQMAIHRYKIKTKKKQESIKKTAQKIMSKMPELCKKSEGLKHKNIILTSASRTLERLEEELYDANIPEELLNGQILENVLEFLIE